MGDLFDTALPIVTLVLGAFLASFGRRSQIRDTMRLEAADMLVELPTLLWAKGQDGAWRAFETERDRLVIRLNMAGVPRHMVTNFAVSAQHFWDNVIEDDEPEPYIMGPDMQPWMITSALMADYLGTNSPFRRWRIRRAFAKEVESPAPAE
jgi:hypothetical protein